MLKLKQKVLNLYRWQNNNIMAFDSNGQQISDIQGRGPITSEKFDKFVERLKREGRLYDDCNIQGNAVWKNTV